MYLTVAHHFLDAAVVEWTSVSSRVAYLDYHCLLARWMEVSISVTTAGFTEQTRNFKADLWLSLHQRSSQLLVMHCWVGFWKRHCSGFLITNSAVHQNTDWKSSLEFWVFETVDSPSFHVCSHLDVSHEAVMFCVGKLKTMWHMLWYCEWCDFLNRFQCF